MRSPVRCLTNSRGGAAARRLTASLLGLFAFALCGAAHASGVTWASAYPTTVGVPTTISLGGGSTVDLTVTTGGAQGLSDEDLGTAGSAETGLDYGNLTALLVFNAGSSGSFVGTTLHFSNFVPGPAHARGFIMVGAVDELSSNVTLTSSTAGAVQTWTQVGTSFTISPGNEDPIDWVPATGTITQGTGVEGIDTGGLVIDVGSIAQYGTITLTLNQDLADGIVYAFGEETATPLPTLAPAAALALCAALLALGVAAVKRRSRQTGGALEPGTGSR